jgi:hypothetical protein
MGVNHYLGTFDSEWDAAAIYGTSVSRVCIHFIDGIGMNLTRLVLVVLVAWAHLILYGEEATRLAQKEGEEAAAAYEQEKKDIADGKIPEPVQKLEKKKKAPVRKPKGKNDEVEGDADGEPNSKKRTASPREGVAKKPRTSSKDPKSEKEMLASILAKGVAKVREHPEGLVMLGKL